jgi:hypothetical protein
VESAKFITPKTHDVLSGVLNCTRNRPARDGIKSEVEQRCFDWSGLAGKSDRTQTAMTAAMNIGQLRYFAVTGATIMRKIAGASIAIAVLATAIWIWPTIPPVTKRVTIEPAQASTASLSPFELMVTHDKNLPVENWPAF